MTQEKFFIGIDCHVFLGKISAPEDIAGVAFFVASDLSSSITGQLMLTGGIPLVRAHPGPIRENECR